MEDLISLVTYAAGDSESVITGRTRPPGVAPLAGKSGTLTANIISSSDPMIKDGIDTNAVVSTIIARSKNVFLFKAANEPNKMPTTRAIAEAIRPNFIYLHCSLLKNDKRI